jgi:hypothetical protein
MADAVASFTENNLLAFNANGEAKDSGIAFATVSTGGSVGSYNVAVELVGTPPATSTQAYLALFTFTETVNFAGNFAGSQGKVGTNPTTAQTWTVNKNGSSVGTIAISTGGAVTFTTTSGATVQFLTGDELTLVGASSADATLANVSLTLQGIRATATAAPIAVVAAYYIGSPTASLIVGMYTFTSTVTFSGNFAGAQGKVVGTNPASTATFTIKKNGSSVGSAAISTGGVFTFTSTSGAAVTFNAGDEMTVVAPGTPDASLATFSMSFPASVSSSTGTSILLKTNGTNNGSQTTLNLVAGTNITLTDSGSGDVTIAAASGLTNPMTTAGDIIVGGSSGTPTRLAAGTSGYVLTSNGAGVAPSYQAASGGSVPLGMSIQPDWPPSPAGSRDDEFTDSVLNAAWTKVNWTSASASLSNSYLSITPDVGAFHIDLITQPQPASTPWTITIKMALPVSVANTWAGLCVYDGTKLITWAVFNNAGLKYSRWTNVSTNSSDTAQTSTGLAFGWTYTYLRIKNDGTNLIFSYSPNGVVWYTDVTESKTAFLSATTYVGIAIVQSGAGTITPLFDFFRSTP